MEHNIMNIKTIIGIIILLFYSSNTISADLPGTELIKKKIEDNKTKKISELSSKTSSIITNFAQDNLSNLKYCCITIKLFYI